MVQRSKNNLSIFEKKQAEINDTQADILSLILSLRNTLQAVAQMRKLQIHGAKDEREKAELIRLQTAVDMRLASLGIEPIRDEPIVE